MLERVWRKKTAYAVGGRFLQKLKRITIWEFPLWPSGLRIQLGSKKMQVQSLALLRGLRIWCCCELWCRSQLWLGSRLVVAVV